MVLQRKLEISITQFVSATVIAKFVVVHVSSRLTMDGRQSVSVALSWTLSTTIDAFSSPEVQSAGPGT